jgi:peptidoglycan/LPS O-acetylase OafA/YrhL
VAHLVATFVAITVAFPLWKQRNEPVLALQFPILCALLAVFVALAFVPRISSRWKTLDKRLGDLSYPLYLNHLVILLLVSNLNAENSGWTSYSLGVLLSIILAAFMYWIVETPLRSVRDRLRGTSLEGEEKRG